MFNARGCTELFQAGLVHIQWARANSVATRKRNACLMAASNKWAQHGNGGAELTHRVKVSVRGDPGWGGDVHRLTVDKNFAAQALKDLRHEGHIQDLRAVVQGCCALYKQCCRHELQHAIFGAVHLDNAFEPSAASD